MVSTAFAFAVPAVMPMGGTAHLVILGIAAVMIFLFNSPGKNIFLNIGLGLWDSYNMATGLLGDILSSYVCSHSVCREVSLPACSTALP